MSGVSISALLTGTIPKPTHNLDWVSDIPAETMEAMRNGETALLHGPDGEPHSILLMDYFGTIREKRI